MGEMSERGGESKLGFHIVWDRMNGRYYFKEGKGQGCRSKGVRSQNRVQMRYAIQYVVLGGKTELILGVQASMHW